MPQAAQRLPPQAVPQAAPQAVQQAVPQAAPQVAQQAPQRGRLAIIKIKGKYMYK